MISAIVIPFATWRDGIALQTDMDAHRQKRATFHQGADGLTPQLRFDDLLK